MKKGDIVYDPDVEFPDGGHADKLFVVLTDANTDGYAYAVLATSKGKSTTPDCQPTNQRFFIKSGKEFPKDTWLELQRKPLIINASILRARMVDSICTIKGTLNAQRVNAIINCIDKHCSDWMSRQYCDLLGIKYKG